MIAAIFRVFLILTLCVLNVTGFVFSAFADDSLKKTLSPYFFVEDGDESLDRVPLKSTQVAVTVDAVIARVTVEQTYINEGTRPINARYVFPASTRAAVHGMRMKIGEQVVVAEIKERQKAEKTYEAARQEGKSASLLTEQRPNVFTMQVANIMPGETIEIHLDYTELLVPEDGVYEFVYPTVVGPRYSTIPADGAFKQHQWIKNPYLKATTFADKQKTSPKFDLTLNINAGLPLEDMACPSHKTEIEWQDKTSAKVLLTPSETNGGNRDYILRYRLTGHNIHSGLMLSQGEAENFFLLMLQPPKSVSPAIIPPREYIFVVDVSGSMNGFPLDTAKVLLQKLIGGLKPRDRFNVILFAGSAQILSPQSLSAEPAHLEKALKLIDQQQGGGGTELLNGLATALNLPRSEGVSRSVVVVTDGYIALEEDVFTLVKQNLSDTNFFAFGIGSSVNRYLIEGFARVGQGEPFVVIDPEQADFTAKRFRQYIESPVLTNIQIHYDGWDTYDTEPEHVSDLFAQRPIVVSGKWRGDLKGKVYITGKTGQGAFRQTVDLSRLEVMKNESALPYLWARIRLADLLDFNPESQNEEIVAEVISLGLTYHLLTPHTAFVAVDKTIRNPERASEDVKQPLPMPKGVSNLAVNEGYNVSEPDLLLMITVLFLGGLAAWFRPKRKRFLEEKDTQHTSEQELRR
ncbi:MAG: VIT domain-containing protein [Desulfobacteraceae bacterium]|jgi:Ca-activated chloride channel family protein